MDAMLGNDERGWLRQVEHLAGAVAGAHGGRHRRPAGRAGRRVMIDDPVRLGNLPQGLAFMTILPARWLVRRFAQARHPRRLLEPVTRWRLAAVGTVQSQPSLKFGDTRFQGRDLGRLRLDQCNQFFPRWLTWRLRIHESLNRNEIPLSRKISGSTIKKCLPTWAVTKNAKIHPPLGVTTRSDFVF